MALNDINVKIGATDKTGAAFNSAEGRMKSMAGAARKLAGGLAAIVGIRALTGAINDAIQYGSALTDAAIATNTNIEALQVLRVAARDAGADETKLEMALVKATKAGLDAAAGLSTQKRAFAALNIDVDAFNKLPTEKKLEMIAIGMRDAEDQNAAYGAAMDIMGTRNAPKLMEVLQRLGKEGYAALATEIKKTNNIMSETDAKSLDAAADSIAKLQTEITLFTGDKIGYWLQFFDAIKNGRENVTGLRDDVSNLLDIIDKIGSFFSSITDARQALADSITPQPAEWAKDFVAKYGPQEAAAPAGTPSISENQAPPAPVAPVAPAYSGFAKSGEDTYGLQSGEWVKISADQLAELQQAKELQSQTLQVIKENNEATKTALSQIASARK